MKALNGIMVLGLMAAMTGACSSEASGEPTDPPGGEAGSAAGAAGTGGSTAGTGGSVAGTGGSASSHLECESRKSSSRPCHDDPDPCGLNSGYPGDEFCLLPPPEGEGIQIHLGPKDHQDAEEVGRYLIHPGEEFNAFAYAPIPTTEDHAYGYVHIQMRPGSHHLINYVVPGEEPEGYLPAGQSCQGEGFPGTQNLVLQSPPGGVQAPENEGLGRTLPGNSSLCLNHHSYNFSDEAQLREVWINVYFMDPDDVTQRARGISLIAGPWTPVQPGEARVINGSHTVSESGRIISMFGHRHAHTERFAVQLNGDLVYDSWDWQESVVFDFDSITENPAPNPSAKTDGAVSGILEVNPGDEITFQCHVHNTSANPLPFANALYEGEMCILFGSSVGTTITSGFGGR